MDSNILEKVLQAIELSNSSTRAYYNLDNSDVVWISEFMFGDEYEKLSEEIESGNYVEMPTSFDVNEYKIMVWSFLQGLRNLKMAKLTTE